MLHLTRTGHIAQIQQGQLFAQGLAVPDGLQDLGRSVWDQDLGDLPLTIIGADTDLMFGPGGDLDSKSSDRLRTAWCSGQEKLALMSVRSLVLIAEGSYHFVQYSDPELIADSVVDMSP